MAREETYSTWRHAFRVMILPIIGLDNPNVFDSCR